MTMTHSVEVCEQIFDGMQIPVDPEHLGLVGQDEFEYLLSATEGGQS